MTASAASVEGMATTIGDTVIDMSNEALRGAPKPKRGGGRPHGGDYRLADDTKVPSVTTILGRYRDPDPLTRWAYKQGDAHGYARAKHGTPSPGMYGDKAAEIGTVVHGAAENLIHGFTPDEAIFQAIADLGGGLDEAKLDKARTSFGAFLDWWEIVSPEVMETEVPLVSERLRYGGTFDAVAKVGKHLCVLDWKTSKRVYLEHKLQLAACAFLWNENHGEGERVERAHCLRFDKFDGGFTHEQVIDLPRFFRAFRCLRDAFELMYGY